MEGFTRSQDDRNPFSSFFRGGDSSPDRFEVDLDDPESFDRQMFDEILFDDPTLPDCEFLSPRHTFLGCAHVKTTFFGGTQQG